MYSIKILKEYCMKKFLFILTCILAGHQNLFSQIFIEDFYTEIIDTSIKDYFKLEDLTKKEKQCFRDIADTYTLFLKLIYKTSFENQIEFKNIHQCYNSSEGITIPLERAHFLFDFFKINMQNWLKSSETAFRTIFDDKSETIKNAVPIDKVAIENDFLKYKRSEAVKFIKVACHRISANP